MVARLEKLPAPNPALRVRLVPVFAGFFQLLRQAHLRDMAMVSVEDKEMKDLLAKHGYTVNVQATPAPGAEGQASTPASTPAAQ